MGNGKHQLKAESVMAAPRCILFTPANYTQQRKARYIDIVTFASQKGYVCFFDPDMQITDTLLNIQFWKLGRVWSSE